MEAADDNAIGLKIGGSLSSSLEKAEYFDGNLNLSLKA